MDLQARLEGIIRRSPAAAFYLALTQVKSVQGATNMFFAERNGLKRLPLLRAADHRVAELGGEIPTTEWVKLIAAGEAVDGDQIRWEKNRQRSG